MTDDVLQRLIAERAAAEMLEDRTEIAYRQAEAERQEAAQILSRARRAIDEHIQKMIIRLHLENLESES